MFWKASYCSTFFFFRAPTFTSILKSGVSGRRRVSHSNIVSWKIETWAKIWKITTNNFFLTWRQCVVSQVLDQSGAKYRTTSNYYCNMPQRLLQLHTFIELLRSTFEEKSSLTSTTPDLGWKKKIATSTSTSTHFVICVWNLWKFREKDLKLK